MRVNSFIIGCLLLLVSCEDIVDVNLPEEDSRLIFDAILRVNIEEPNENRISISRSASFFEEIQPSEVEEIQLQGGGLTFYAPDPDVPGDWIPGSDNVPIEDQLLLRPTFNTEDDNILAFYYRDELYIAITKYVTVPEITSLNIGDNTILDDDETEIIVAFSDPEEEENYYIFGYGNGEFITVNDQFFNGQEYSFSFFSDQKLETGDSLTLKMWGVTEDFYNYFSQLLVQSEMGEDTLFQTPVSTVRGNILLAEDIDNIDIFNNVGRPQEFVLGYFAIVQERTKTIIL